jgi:hypothetical protein
MPTDVRSFGERFCGGQSKVLERSRGIKGRCIGAIYSQGWLGGEARVRMEEIDGWEESCERGREARGE